VAQISPEVADILRRATIKGTHLTLPPRLDRSEYLAVNAVIENLGGKWSRKDKAHVFASSDAFVALDEALDRGAFTDRKKELQYFPTPDALARRMAELANVSNGDCVLEPSAGQGSIVNALLFYTPRIVAVEIDPTNCLALATQRHIEPHCADFLDWAEEADGVEFDAVVMNPPFCKGQDIAHVYAAWRLLKTGGRLVAITSPGWQFRQDKLHTAFASWLKDLGAITTELEPGTFKESGTDVRTTLIVMKKDK